MTENDPGSQIRLSLRNSAPELSPQACQLLVEMYLAEYAQGTEAADPVLIQPGVRVAIGQGAQLHKLVRTHHAKRSLEIGFAYGFSTVWLLDALAVDEDASHVAVDPYERSIWGGVGLHRIRSIPQWDGKFTLIEKHAIQALPRMIEQGERFDFIFIDGNHRFDDVIVDFYLSDQLLAPGGIIALDDMWMPSVRGVADFIENNRSYELVRQPVSNMAVFRKLADDTRSWDHFRTFRPAGGVRARVIWRLRLMPFYRKLAALYRRFRP